MKIYCAIKHLGIVDYHQAYQMQKQYVKEVIEGEPAKLILCQHPLVITMGRMAKQEHVFQEQEILNQGINIVAIDRGGDVTMHSKGQLVVYPIFDLKGMSKDLHLYLRKLEQVAIDFLRGFDILANRIENYTGVWVKDKKIASIGIGVKKWVAFHGLSININNNIKEYQMIKPCGLDVSMTSLSEITGQNQTVEQVEKKIIDCFVSNFDLNIID